MEAIQLENLWQYLRSLDMTESNRQWLSDKLLHENGCETNHIAREEEILAGIDAGLHEMALTKAGKLRAKSAWEFLNEL